MGMLLHTVGSESIAFSFMNLNRTERFKDVGFVYAFGEDWGQVNVEPKRSASALLVHTKTFLVSFDMTRPLRLYS